MDDLLASIAAKKAELDRLRPLTPRALKSLEHAYDLELTYTSNAIEGNRLTQLETNLVIEQGVTVGGKKLKDHLEAVDLFEALQYVRNLAARDTRLGEHDIRSLHALVTRRSEPEISGRYATAARYVVTDAGRRSFPSPAEIPALMGDFAAWLAAAPAAPDNAFTAHRRLVDIHPFNDGNGRTARLLMNLILIRGGYPPVAVRPEDRLAYLKALQSEDQAAFQGLLFGRLSAPLDDYLAALRQATA